MFEEKKYSWLLAECAKIRARIKILDVGFLKSDQIDSSYTTNSDGFIASVSSKNQTTREMLKKYLAKRTNILDSSLVVKPIAYAAYSLIRKVFYSTDVHEIIRKESKMLNLKEIYLFQDYYHEHNIYYSVDIAFDGEGLVSYVTKKDVFNADMSIKDSKYIYLAVTLTKYLTTIIENALDKNLIRLSYDFVVDPHFNLIILTVPHIKVMHPRVIALNRGLNVDQLENLTLVKNEYKNLTYSRIPSIVKEPEPESSLIVPQNPSVSTNIFINFVSKFLSGESKKNYRRRSEIASVLSDADQPTYIHKTSAIDSNGPLYNNEVGIETSRPLGPKFRDSEQVLKYSERPASITTKYNKSITPSIRFSIPRDIKPASTNNASSTSRVLSKNTLFPFLLPSQSLSLFLKNEEERIQESKTKRSQAVEFNIEKLPNLKKKVKKVKKIVRKKLKKPRSERKLPSPYIIF